MVLSPQAGQYLPNAVHRRWQLSHHPISFKPQHGIAQAVQHLITPGIRPAPGSMVTAIHFHYECDLGSEQIHDEAPSNRNLPPESNSKPAAIDGLKEKLFGAPSVAQVFARAEPRCRRRSRCRGILIAAKRSVLSLPSDQTWSESSWQTAA
jgi:hypothetical protein